MLAQLHNFIIYKTVNLVNGKIYVGQHKGGKASYLGSGVVFREAIKKYGRENFRREDIEELRSCTQERADERERYWIKKLKSKDARIGYNLASGGLTSRGRVRVAGVYKHSKESLKKIRAAAKKRKGKPAWNRGRNDYLTEDMLKKMRKPKSEATKKKLREIKKTTEQINKAKATKLRKKKEGYVVKYRTKRVVQKTLNNKEVKVWDSITQAHNALGLSISDISRVCKNISKTCGGFKWEYAV